MKGGSITRRAEIGRERRERTAEKLLRSAAEVIAGHGAEKATIDDFISAAGVARGTFYNHFKTREALLDALWTRLGRDPFVEIKQLCDPIEDPVARFSALTRHVLRKTYEDTTWGWLVFATSGSAETVNDDLRTYPRPDLLAGKALGRFAFEDIDSASDMVVASVRAAMKAILTNAASQTYLDSFVILILRAVGVSAKEAKQLSRASLATALETAAPA